MTKGNPDGHMPQYIQIKQKIIQQIATGELEEGHRIPGRWALTELYGSSWATVNRAIQELILEGRLYAEKGKGTFVSAAPPSSDDHHMQDNQLLSVMLCSTKGSIYYSLQRMMEGIRQQASAAGKSVQFVDLSDHDRLKRDLDGWLIITPEDRDWPLLIEANRRGEHFVVIGSCPPNGVEIDWVNADTSEGTQMAVQHMIQLGHRKVALFGLQYELSNYVLEVEGYQKAMKAAGLQVDEQWIVYRPELLEDVIRAFDQWYESHSDCTAIFAADYTSALAILSWAMDSDVEIPNDLSLFAMDELPSSPFLRVPLNSVVQPFVEMGRLAVRALDASTSRPTQMILPCHLLIRESVQAMK